MQFRVRLRDALGGCTFVRAALLPRCSYAWVTDNGKLSECWICNFNFRTTNRSCDGGRRVLNRHKPAHLARYTNHQICTRKLLTEKSLDTGNVTSVTLCQDAPLKDIGRERRELKPDLFVGVPSIHELVQRSRNNTPSHLTLYLCGQASAAGAGPFESRVEHHGAGRPAKRSMSGLAKTSQPN